MNLVHKLRSLGGDQKGLSTVEYTVLLVLIVAIAVGLWKSFGETVGGQLSRANKSFKTSVVNAKDLK